MRVLCCTIALAVLLPAQTVELFRDDFAGLPPGWLSSPVGVLNPAIQAYHYLPHRGVPLGKWANAICHLDAWAIGDEDGKPYLEQMTVNYQKSAMNPIFLTGEPEWADYAVQAKVKPLNLSDMAGLVFRYRTNRHYYLFALTAGDGRAWRCACPSKEVSGKQTGGNWRAQISRTIPSVTTR